VKKLADEKKAADKRKDRARLKKLAGLGFEGDNVGEVVLL
jgi:U6 snRNA-associated Sm-like protein LSm1